VVHGPATAPAKAFGVRVVDGVVSARAPNALRSAGSRPPRNSHQGGLAQRAVRAFIAPWK
jgi:hypothetical protein